MNPAETILIVDDEAGLRKALTRLLRAEGFTVQSFASAEEFLAASAVDGGCVILDIAMPGLDGLALQQRLIGNDAALPVVFLTGHGDIPQSVQAIKSGAVDFLLKPVDDAVLLKAVRAALKQSGEQRRKREQTSVLRTRLDRLTPREREVLVQVVSGKLNKQIAAELGAGEHTIKIHRSRVMEKMEVGSLAELVRAAMDLDISPAGVTKVQ